MRISLFMLQINKVFPTDIKRIALRAISAPERNAKHYFPYREVRIICAKHICIIGKDLYLHFTLPWQGLSYDIKKQLQIKIHNCFLYFLYFRKPLIICSSASASVRPKVINLIICSPAILPIAAS